MSIVKVIPVREVESVIINHLLRDLNLKVTKSEWILGNDLLIEAESVSEQDKWTITPPASVNWYWAWLVGAKTYDVFYFDGTDFWQGSAKYLTHWFEKFARSPIQHP